MSNIKLQTLKGFRDFLPPEAIKRQIVVDKIKKVFEKFGFDPLETPTLEYSETLRGKYGEEEKLIYEFRTKGGDQVALKYDQTVPLARVIAQYGQAGPSATSPSTVSSGQSNRSGPSGSQQTLPIPFKRYQIQPAFRGEKPQKGRYREFLQCDVDIIGASSTLADAEILAVTFEVYKNLGLDVLIKINDRSLLVNIEPKYLSAIDKLNKIGKQVVLKELQAKGLPLKDSLNTLNQVKKLKPTKNLDNIIAIYQQMGYPSDSIQFDPTLIRGLDYYTGLILEVVLRSEPGSSSLCGGGRWDKMIGQFTGIDLPAVGFAIGLDRTIEAMDESRVLDTPQTNTRILVTVFSEDLLTRSIQVLSLLRLNNINSEIWLNPSSKLDKQLKYADAKGIPYALIIGPDEAEKNKVSLKSLNTKTQQQFTLDELTQKLTG